MFMMKLVKKAAKMPQQFYQHEDDNIQSLKAEQVNPRIAFHHGIPSGSSLLAYDSIQNILAVSTNDGRIKLFGMDGTQAFLQAETASPSKFLQFIENRGILLNINLQNHVEVWDIDAKELCYVHISDEDITSYAVTQQNLCMYIGNCHGDVHLLKLIPEMKMLENTRYNIPYTESYRKTNESNEGVAVVGIFPQLMAENDRILIMFEDGLLSIWSIQENKAMYTTGGISQISAHREAKKAVTACWTCPFGSKLVVGYNSGEVFIWGIPTISGQENGATINQNIPLSKLNLGFKTDRIRIVSLRCVFGDGKANRLYVSGFSDNGSYAFQVLLLSENSGYRTLKLALPLSEPCLSTEFVSCFNDKTKLKQNFLILLSKSGKLHLYNDSHIERYLLQLQSKTSPSVPNHYAIKLPYSESSITTANLYTSYSVESNYMGEEQLMQLIKYSNLFLVDKREKDSNCTNSSTLNGISKTNKLYITGHQDGTVNFWDASCHLLLAVLSIKYNNEDVNAAVTTLHFDISSQILFTGDKNGLVRIITFRKEQVASENIVSFLQGKHGGNYDIYSVKVKGAIQSIGFNPDSKYLAIGTDKGFVFLYDMESATFLYKKQFPSQHHTGINSLQFKSCNHNGYAKNILFIGIQDSSVFAIEEETGNELNASAVYTESSSTALSMQILESQLLFCSDNAVRLYSLSHALNGIKKVNFKKRLSGICCYASVIRGPTSEVGLLLVFTSGKVEIRSLPALSLLKETSLGGFTNKYLESSMNTSNVICASPEGEFVMVNGDQEILFLSALIENGSCRNMEHISQVYKRKNSCLQEDNSITTNEKKKVIIGMVKDLTGTMQRHGETEMDDYGANDIEELSTFSMANFSLHPKNKKSVAEYYEDIDLNIDDIDLDDNTKKKSKGMKFSTIINKKKLRRKVLAIKDKIMTKTEKKLHSLQHVNDDNIGDDMGANMADDGANMADDMNVGSVNQIKKKYGYTTHNEIASTAHNKLLDNAQKLTRFNDRVSDMRDMAQTFSSRSNEVLRNSQKNKKGTYRFFA